MPSRKWGRSLRLAFTPAPSGGRVGYECVALAAAPLPLVMTAGEVAEADDEVVVPLSATTTDPIGAPTMASLAFLLIVPRAFRVAALFPTEEELARAQRRAQGRRLQDDASQDAVAHRWTECLAKLDEARALDPELDEDPEVKDLRAAAAKALAGDGDAGKAGDARQ